MATNGRNSTILISIGTVLGQAFIMLSMPIISRLYSPEDMGQLIIYTSVIGLFTTIAALHYELAIPLPFSKKRAAELTVASFLIVAVLTCIMLLILYVAGAPLLQLIKADSLVQIMYLLPIGFAITGVGNIWTLFSIRYQTHKRNALSKTMQGIGQAIAQIVAGYMSLNWIWLIFGQLFGLILSIVPLVNIDLFKQINLKSRFAFVRVYVLLKKYKKFPFVAVPSSFIVSITNNSPPLLLAAFFGSNIAGFYGLGFRVLQIPIRFVGQAVSQVFLGQSAQAKREGVLSQLVSKIFRAIFGFSLHTFVPLVFFAPSLFSVVFGNDWTDAGIYTQWLTPWLLAGFIATPLSMLVTVLQKQEEELFFQIIYLIVIATALASGTFINDPTVSVQALGGAGGIFLFIKIWWLLGIAGCNRFSLVKETITELFFVALVNAPLVALLTLLKNTSEINTLIGVLWITLIHLINFKYRKLYEF
jgi:lipopolysaccharide exporter